MVQPRDLFLARPRSRVGVRAGRAGRRAAAPVRGRPRPPACRGAGQGVRGDGPVHRPHPDARLRRGPAARARTRTHRAGRGGLGGRRGRRRRVRPRQLPQCARRAARRRGLRTGGHRRHGGPVRPGVLPGAAARPPRRAGPGHGAVPVQQPGGGRPRRAGARCAPRADPGLGRPPRQRHPTDLLRGPRRAVRVGPPGGALPGGVRSRAGDRRRRGRGHHAQRAAARRLGPRRLPRRDGTDRGTGGPRLRPRSDPGRGGRRRERPRPDGSDAVHQPHLPRHDGGDVPARGRTDRRQDRLRPRGRLLGLVPADAGAGHGQCDRRPAGAPGPVPALPRTPPRPAPPTAPGTGDHPPGGPPPAAGRHGVRGRPVRRLRAALAGGRGPG